MSATQNPRLRIKLGEPVGNEIFFAFPEIQGNEKSFFDADAVAGATTLTASGTNFTVNDYIILGQPGSEKTEIVQVTGATSTTISVTATVFAHNRGDLIQFIPYNQITPERSVNAGVTFTPLTAINIRPDASETYLQRATDASTDVYRFRFTNSTTANNSAYSDNATASGYADNSVYAIKRRALTQLGEKYTDLITSEALNDALNEARRMVDQDPRILRWSFRTKFNTDVGDMIAGRWSLAVPTDLRDKNTYKNILGLRLGRNNRPCTYQDDRTFRNNYRNIAHTTLNGAITPASITAVLTQSGDFDTAGTINIAAEDITGVRDPVAYTGNTLLTNTLTGVTGIAVNHASGRDVWQNATFGLPVAFTIDNGVVYFNVPFDDTYAGENIWMDYYQELQAVNSDSDLLDEPSYDFYVNYLKYKIKYLKANGKLDADTDTDYKEFQKGITGLISQETQGQFIRFIPSTFGSNNSSLE